MNYRISKLASQDLENIWLFTFENWSVEQADRYYNLILDEIEYISEYPYSGKDYGEIRKGYFRTIIKSHLIFYKINKKTDEIEIIRILHQRMDIETQLEEKKAEANSGKGQKLAGDLELLHIFEAT